MSNERPQNTSPALLLRAPLVGRATDLERLEGAMQRAEAERKLVAATIIGAHGVGKSRLGQELVARLQRRDAPPRLYRGSARGATGPLAPLASLLRDRFGLVDGMSAETSKMWVRSQVAELLDDRKVGDLLYFLGQLLDLPFPESPLTRAVRDDALQGRLLRRAVLRQLIEADAAAGPVLVWLDDAHEAPAEALEVAAYLTESVTGPVVMLFSARSELFHRSEALCRALESRYVRVDLGPLGERESATVVEALLEPCGEVPEGLVRAACSLAGGNPMLLERMVRIFHDAGVLEVEREGPEAGRWLVHDEKLATARLPLTVDDAVEARLSALAPEERRLLERATVMGSVFWLRGLLAFERVDAPPPELWAHSDDEADALRLRLDALVSRDYVLRLPDSTFQGDVEYVFKHNKERERLAQGLGAAEARRLHQVLADWLTHKPQLRAHEEHMGLLARQHELAGSPLLAALRLLDAGDVARSRYANARAAEYYTRGLELLGDADAARRLDALHNLGDVFLLLGRLDSALEQFVQMLSLAFRLDALAKGGAAHNRIGRLYRDTGRLNEAQRHLQAGFELFQRASDERGVASSIDDLGKVHWLRGDYVRALEAFRQGLEMRQSLGDRRSIALSLNNLGLALQDSGSYQQAREAFEQSLDLRRQIGDLLGIVTSLNNIGTLAQDEGDHASALGLFQEALAAAREVGDKNRTALVLTNLGETYHRLGHPAEAIAVLEQAEELCDELGDKLGLAEAMRGLGRAYLLQGDMLKARACVARAVELFAVVRSKAHLGLALRALGEITAAGAWGEAHVGKAHDYFLQSIQIFEDLGNGLEVARSCEALARFLRSAGQEDDAAQASARARDLFEQLRGALRGG